MSTWKLKRTVQCAKCPWRKDVDPNDIPNGYDVEKHKALSCTIATPGELSAGPMRAMACHETENSESWMLLLAAPVPRSGRVTVGAKDLQLIRRVGARDDGLHHGHRAALGAVGATVPVQVVHFQERHEGLAAAATSASQQGDDLGSGVVAILPLSLGCDDAVAFALPGASLPLPDVSPSSIGSTTPFDGRLSVVRGGVVPSALLAPGGPPTKTFRVGTELIERLREAAARAHFHRVIIPPSYCVGWLVNQAGIGNNIALRLRLMSCENGHQVRTIGEQHLTLGDTLPRKVRAK